MGKNKTKIKNLERKKIYKTTCNMTQSQWRVNTRTAGEILNNLLEVSINRGDSRENAKAYMLGAMEQISGVEDDGPYDALEIFLDEIYR